MAAATMVGTMARAIRRVCLAVSAGTRRPAETTSDRFFRRKVGERTGALEPEVRCGAAAEWPPKHTGTPMAAVKEKTLADAFYETLKDVHYAEKAGLKALKKNTKAAKSEELKEAFQNHGEETARQIERLQEVFEIIGKPARSKTCEAMQGLVSEMEEDLDDFGDTPAGDAVLIGCAQAVEHYEIARYGMLRTWARQLGYDDAVRLLDETLAEEKKSDELLTTIADQANVEGMDEGDDAEGATPMQELAAKPKRGSKAKG